MKKYYIGLLIISLMTVGLTIYVLSLGVSGKQDKQTQKRAETIAADLNAYIRSNNKVPESLDAANIQDVPDTVKYEKKSGDRYEFCVTYKTASQGYASTSVSEIVLKAAYPQLGDTSDYESDYERSSLYLLPGHKAGANCQTVKPYISSNSRTRTDTLFSEDSDYCDPTGEYYEFYKSYCGAAEE